ncbi:phosphodiester glycosidase family protein [Jatrophihabitans fulvus]
MNRRILPAALTSSVLSLLLASLAVGTVTGTVVGTSPAGAASDVTTLSPGVTLTTYSFSLGVGRRALPQRVMVVTARLGARTALVPAAGSGLVGGPRADTPTIARRQHAVAGVNGDFFDLDDPNSPPRGGLMRDGILYKSARTDTAATLYVTADGRAHIGDPGYRATVTAPDRATHRVGNVNNVEYAMRGGITLATPALAPTGLHGRCTAAGVRTVVTTRTVRSAGRTRSVRTVTRTVASVQKRVRAWARLAAGQRTLLACGEGGDWLAAHLRRGGGLGLDTAHTVAGVRSYIGGGRVLLRHNAPYRDTPSSITIPNRYRNPLTFACVSADGATVRLGTVDGGSRTARGMTYGELTGWLRDTLRCWSAIMFDGGGSTTMVARMPGAPDVTVRNVPAYGVVRPVPDGLFVVRR